MSFRLWLESSTPGKLYIRFGSIVGSSECKMGKDFDRKGECGLSVYDAKLLGGPPSQWNIDEPETYLRIRRRNPPGLEYYELEYPDSRQAIYSLGGSSYWKHMMEQFGCQGRDIYLVTGDEVRFEAEHPEYDDRKYWHYPKGADGEPLLDSETVNVVKQLEAHQVLAGGRLVDEYCTYGWHDPNYKEED